MKNYTLLLIFISLTFATATIAQEADIDNRKNYFVGGAINYSLTNTNKVRLANSPFISDSEFLTSSIHFGRRFAKNSAIGIRGTYSKSTSISFSFDFASNLIDESTFTESNYKFEVFYRHYFNIKNKFFFILEPGIAYSRTESEPATVFIPEFINSLIVGLAIIPSYRIADRWNIFVNLGSLNYEFRENPIPIDGPGTIPSKTNIFSFDFRLRDLQLGAEWLF